MRVNTPVVSLILAVLAASVASAQSFTPDSVDVQIVDGELVGIRDGAPATRERLRPGELVVWHGTRGTVALLEMDGAGSAGFGLLALYQGEGDEEEAGFRALAVDAQGRRRPEWAQRLTSPPVRTRRGRPETWTRRRGWRELVEKMAAALPGHTVPDAVAAFRFIRQDGDPAP